jgi:hypothetical protein
MLREIVTSPIERKQLHEELDFMVQYFLEKGVTTCTVLFGFAWGNDYYPGNEWFDEEIPLEKLVEKVREIEESGIGALGKDHLCVNVSDLEFQFCNDSDIHIRFTESNNDSESFYLRWKQLGYQPAEWVKNKENDPGKRVRSN